MLLNMDVNRVCKTIVVDRMTMLPTNLFLKVYTNPSMIINLSLSRIVIQYLLKPKVNAN